MTQTSSSFEAVISDDKAVNHQAPTRCGAGLGKSS